jgi:hypothetical protein
LDHSLLADVFAALEGEDTGWGGAVLDEELGLVLALREVFEEHSGADLSGEHFDQS